MILIVFGVILISMTLHEAVHAFVGYWLGDDTAKAQGRLTLNPLKHIDPFLTLILPMFLAIAGGPIFGGAKPVPLNPGRIRYGEWGMALVAIAGPLTNLVLAFLMFGIGVISGVISSSGVSDTLIGTIIVTSIYVNLGFFIFNILPIPPLDGSRVLYALAPDFAKKIMEQMERYGLVFILIIVLVASPVINSIMSQGMKLILDAFMFIFRV